MQERKYSVLALGLTLAGLAATALAQAPRSASI